VGSGSDLDIGLSGRRETQKYGTITICGFALSKLWGIRRSALPRLGGDWFALSAGVACRRAVREGERGNENIIDGQNKGKGEDGRRRGETRASK